MGLKWTDKRKINETNIKTARVNFFKRFFIAQLRGMKRRSRLLHSAVKPYDEGASGILFISIYAHAVCLLPSSLASPPLTAHLSRKVTRTELSRSI